MIIKLSMINKEKSVDNFNANSLNGGVGETRTLAPVTRSTSLAGKPLHQLGYYSSAPLILT